MENQTVFKRYDDALFKALYDDLSVAQNLLSPYATKDKQAVRRHPEKFHVARPNYVKDIERIINCRFFNRYTDKTQVFSLYRNDDISRRALHVQLVSRIARNLGRMLKLNQDLIEAIALGHDLGHPPFGHLGERFLSEILFERAGALFRHNIQSVRILDKILKLNLSLQVLDGILSHNGERVVGEYHPLAYLYETPEEKFGAFDEKVKLCAEQSNETKILIPSTLEGCVVRLSDIIAYIGKDRQDAILLGIGDENAFEKNELLGNTNAEFISNIIFDVVTNSYGKDHIMLKDDYAEALGHEMAMNYKMIYEPQDKSAPIDDIKKIYRKLFDRLYKDLIEENFDSPIYRHHIGKIFAGFKFEQTFKDEYIKEDKYQIVVDYIASMTDDYFLELYEYLYPNSININFHCYFNKM